MQNAIIKFEFEGKPVRTVDVDGETQWVAKDVCEVLELSDTSMALRRLDEDEKGTSIVGTPGGQQEMLTVNESGLYALIFRSRKPVARRFRKWVTSEVLPQIRERGYYVRKGDEARVIADLQSQVLELWRYVGANKYGLLDRGASALRSRIRDLRNALMSDGVEVGSVYAVQKIVDNQVRSAEMVNYPSGKWEHCPPDKAAAAHSYVSKQMNRLDQRRMRREKHERKASQAVIDFQAKKRAKAAQ